MQTITVKAREGVRVPKEDSHRAYITHTPVAVPLSAYYLRRLAEGDLVRVEPKPKGEK